MRLRVFLPMKILIDQEVTKVVAEAENGSFGILPKHIDFVAALAPGSSLSSLAKEKSSWRSTKGFLSNAQLMSRFPREKQFAAGIWGS